MKPTDNMYIFTLVQKMTCVKMTLLAMTTAAFISGLSKDTCNTHQNWWICKTSSAFFFSNYHFLPPYFFMYDWFERPCWCAFLSNLIGFVPSMNSVAKTNVDRNHCKLVWQLKLSVPWFCGGLQAGCHKSTASRVSRWSCIKANKLNIDFILWAILDTFKLHQVCLYPPCPGFVLPLWFPLRRTYRE